MLVGQSLTHGSWKQKNDWFFLSPFCLISDTEEGFQRPFGELSYTCYTLDEIKQRDNVVIILVVMTANLQFRTEICPL